MNQDPSRRVGNRLSVRLAVSILVGGLALAACGGSVDRGSASAKGAPIVATANAHKTPSHNEDNNTTPLQERDLINAELLGTVQQMSSWTLRKYETGKIAHKSEGWSNDYPFRGVDIHGSITGVEDAKYGGREIRTAMGLKGDKPNPNNVHSLYIYKYAYMNNPGEGTGGTRKLTLESLSMFYENGIWTATVETPKNGTIETQQYSNAAHLEEGVQPMTLEMTNYWAAALPQFAHSAASRQIVTPNLEVTSKNY